MLGGRVGRHCTERTLLTAYRGLLYGLFRLYSEAARRYCFLAFEHLHFEIIHSAFDDPSQHRVAISFFTDPLHWHEPTLGPFLLLSSAPPAASPGE